MSTTHWVKANEPTSLGELKYLPIQPLDYLNYCGDVTYTFPGALDSARLKDALAKTLQLYPHCAGRVSHNQETNTWRIMLTNEGALMTFSTTEHASIFRGGDRSEKPNDGILDPLLPFVPGSAMNQPLLKFNIVELSATGETALSVAMHHFIGDAITYINLMKTFSDFYQGLPAPTTAPTFEKYLHSDPTLSPSDSIDDVLPYFSHLTVDYPREVMMKEYMKTLSSISRIDITISAEQLRGIAELVKRGPGSTLRVSTLDCLAEYLINLHNKVSKGCIEQILHVFEFRGIGRASNITYVPPALTSAGNAIVMFKTGKFSSNPTRPVGAIANTLRESVNRIRQPEVLARTLALFTTFRARAMRNPGRSSPVGVSEKCIMINNLSKLPYNSHHFGYPGQSLLHYWGYNEFAIGILPENPRGSPGGRWEERPGGVDINMGIRASLKSEFLRAFGEDMKALGTTERYRGIECKL